MLTVMLLLIAYSVQSGEIIAQYPQTYGFINIEECKKAYAANPVPTEGDVAVTAFCNKPSTGESVAVRN